MTESCAARHAGGPLRLGLFVLTGCLALAAAAVSQPTLEPVSGLPDGLPEPLAALLDPAGLRLTEGGSTLVEFWFPTSLPLRDPTGEIGIEYGQLVPGSFVGVLRTEGAWKDYKDQAVPAGVYTLRYGVQPADGDHTGQTWFRDFLMLVPPAIDEFPPEIADQEAVVEASNQVLEGEHPTVVGLFQIYDPVEAPAVVDNDLGQAMLAVQRGELLLGLVLIGHGEVATF